MPVVQQVDSGVVLRFLFNQLMASTVWRAIHGDRIYQQNQVPDGEKRQYCVYKSRQDQIIQWPAQGGAWIGKMRSDATVSSIAPITQSRGDERYFNDALHAAREALDGFRCYPVLDENDETIGAIYQSIVTRWGLRPRMTGTLVRDHFDIEINLIHL